jgi:hypothetical protein
MSDTDRTTRRLPTGRDSLHLHGGVVLGQGSHYAALIEASRAALADYRQADERATSATDALRAEHPEIRETIDQVVELVMDRHEASTLLAVAELARHLPGLAPTLELVWSHCHDMYLDRVGRCCICEKPITDPELD